MLVGGSAMDQQRAGRVMGERLADGPQEESREPAMPTRADHEEVGVPSGVDEHLDRRSLDCDGLDGNVRVANNLLDQRLREALPFLPNLRQHLDEIETRRRARRDHRGRRLPSVDGEDVCLAQPGLVQSPAKRFLRGIRAVDAYHDLRHAGFLPRPTRVSKYARSLA